MSMSAPVGELKQVLKSRWKRAEGRIVEVLWLDASFIVSAEWGDHEDAYEAKPARTLSVGYVARETEDHITLVALINSDFMSGGICIPRAMIQEQRELTVRNG
jgi:hypothetical protein